MSFNTNITVGRPPLLWSDVQDAFTQVNENFDILAATIGTGSGLSPIDFTTLDTSVKPTTDNLYDLGDATHRWKSVFTGEYGVADLLNGVWAGSAQIKGVGTTVNLPNGSTVGGDPLTGVGASLIIDPDKTFFKEIQVDNASSVVATSFADTFNLFSGTGINLTVSSGADSITVTNSGIISVSAGNGISTSTASGVATISNTGVRSIDNISGLPAGRTLGAGINVSASTGDNVRITNTGVISVSSGVGITVSLDAATGDVTITNSLPAGNTFAQVEVNGDSANRLIADAASDVLNITSGQGITLSKTVANDTLSIAVNPVFDLKGSVFGDDSSILVDAVSNYIYGNVSATTLRTSEARISLGDGAGSATAGTAIAIGQAAGSTNQSYTGIGIGFTAGGTNQGTAAVGIGTQAGETDQGNYAVAIGSEAGQFQQGLYAVAIGRKAGETTQPAGSIIINASGGALNGVGAGFYVDPIRSTANGRPLMYDTSTKELFSSNVLEFVGSTISTSDSSGIVIDVLTTFQSDVVIESDLTVAGNLIVNGNTTTINSVTLTVDDKNIELGSTASPTDVTADGGGITLKGTTDKTFTYVNSTGLWTANIGIQATEFTGSAAAATTASTADSVGYLGLPASAVTTTATLGISDIGKHIYVNTAGQTITIPANSSVAYPIGSALSFIAGPSATTVSIAITTDTMYLAGTGTTGTRTLAAHGMATAVKVAATVWYINGTGLT